MTTQTLTPSARAELRKALLHAGHKTAGLSEADMIQLAEKEGLNTPAPKADKIDLSDAQPGEFTPAMDTPAPEQAPAAPAAPDTAAPAATLAAAIEAAIQAATAATAGAVDEDQVKALIKKHASQKQIVEHIVTVNRPDRGEPVQITGAHPMLARTLDVFSIGENVLLTGPASSGKTTLAMQAAEALELEFFGTGAVVDKFELLGFVDAGGKYHDTALYRFMKAGGVFLFDEVDSSYPAPLNAFNALLENGFVTFPNGETLYTTENHHFIAAANTIGTGANRTYVGRFELDRAFLDRWVQLTVEIDEGIERAMAANAWTKAGGPADEIQKADDWATIVREFRDLLDARRILALCTTRATRRGAALLAIGWDLDAVKQAELYKHLSADQLKQLNIKGA